VQVDDLPGPLTNTVTVSGTTAVGPVSAISATATVTVNLSSTPAITIVKRANVTTTEVGQTIIYTYRVTNSGTITLTGITGSDDKLGPVTFSPDILAPNQDVGGVLTYTVQVSDLPGPLTNTVTASGTTAVGPVSAISATATVTVNLQTETSAGLYLPIILK
jgi:hypothetical protein